MTVREALSDGVSALTGAGFETPFLDASLLLARAAGLSRESLFAWNPKALSPEVESRFQDFLSRRLRGECVAYLLGEKEFYGRMFRVDARVLVPRPDTEALVEAALETARSILAMRGDMAAQGQSSLETNPIDSFGGAGGQSSRTEIRLNPSGRLRIHDAFTGSGCVGVTLAAELPDAEVSLSDLSPGARELAQANARALLGRGLKILESDVMDSVDGPFDLIVANPPYVASAETDRILGASPIPFGEPRIALDGGPDGLSLYRRLVPEAEKRLASGGVLVVEIGEEQGAEVLGLFHRYAFRGTELIEDLAGRDRVVRGIRT